MRVCKWYTYGDDDGRERMVRLLGELKPGGLFVFKIRNRLNDLYEPYDGPMAPDGNREMKARFLKKRYSTEYAVMKRTGKREYVMGRPDTYDLSAKPTAETIESFYFSYAEKRQLSLEVAMNRHKIFENIFKKCSGFTLQKCK